MSQTFPFVTAKFPVFSLSGKSKSQIPSFPCAMATRCIPLPFALDNVIINGMHGFQCYYSHLLLKNILSSRMGAEELIVYCRCDSVKEIYLRLSFMFTYDN